jgi:hypothetical protein
MPIAQRIGKSLSVFQYEEFGEEASMVMQWTVNPPPLGTTGSIPVFSTNLRRKSFETLYKYY